MILCALYCITQLIDLNWWTCSLFHNSRYHQNLFPAWWVSSRVQIEVYKDSDNGWLQNFD